MEEQNYIEGIEPITDKSLFDEQEQQPTKAYKVTETKNGVAIKLEGYEISFIRIIKDTRFNKYSILVRDVDGMALKLNKSADSRVVAATLFRMEEREGKRRT